MALVNSPRLTATLPLTQRTLVRLCPSWSTLRSSVLARLPRRGVTSRNLERLHHNVHLLKRHNLYHESDHVLNIVFNIISGGKRIEHIELRRNNEVYLKTLGA